MPIQIETPAIRMLRDRLLETGGAPSVVATDESVAHADTEEALGGDVEAIALLGATIEAMVIMLAADGNVSQAEKDLLRGAVRELTAGGVRSVEIDKLFEAALVRVKEQGADRRLAEAAAVLKKETIASEAAFVLAAAMAVAAQDIADAQNQTMNRFADQLGLEEGRANQLLDELET